MSCGRCEISCRWHHLLTEGRWCRRGSSWFRKANIFFGREPAPSLFLHHCLLDRNCNVLSSLHLHQGRRVSRILGDHPAPLAGGFTPALQGSLPAGGIFPSLAFPIFPSPHGNLWCICSSVPLPVEHPPIFILHVCTLFMH